jgi:hypothetical protein
MDMTKRASKYFYFVIVLLINLALCASGYPCKYTVRDIGFTDLGATDYKLYIIVGNETSAEMRSSMHRIAYAAFLDANITCEIIDKAMQADHPVIKHLSPINDVSLPVFILTDPEGNDLVRPFEYNANQFKQSLWQFLDAVVSSPLREELSDRLIETYGIVLLIEGTNTDKKEQAKEEITKAIENIKQVMQLMPKPVKNPPQMVVLPRQEVKAESVLLWSLGEQSIEMEEPRVAVLYSRGRRIGPLLKGKEINRENIFNLLAIIGADCECGLDRSVMLGRMIPIRWEREYEERLIHLLGFDVENPLIKSEMQQILSMPQALQSGQHAKNPLSAYKEGIIEFDSEPIVPTVSSNPFRISDGEDTSNSEKSIIHVSLYSLGGVFIIILIIGCVIAIRSRK